MSVKSKPGHLGPHRRVEDLRDGRRHRPMLAATVAAPHTLSCADDPACRGDARDRARRRPGGADQPSVPSWSTATSWSSPPRSCRRPRAARSSSRRRRRRRSPPSGRRRGTRTRGWSRSCCANRRGSCARSGRSADHRDPARVRVRQLRRRPVVERRRAAECWCCRPIPTRRRAGSAPGCSREGRRRGDRHRHLRPSVARRADRRRHRCRRDQADCGATSASTIRTVTSSGCRRSASSTRSPAPPNWSRATSAGCRSAIVRGYAWEPRRRRRRWRPVIRDASRDLFR